MARPARGLAAAVPGAALTARRLMAGSGSAAAARAGGSTAPTGGFGDCRDLSKPQQAHAGSGMRITSAPRAGDLSASGRVDGTSGNASRLGPPPRTTIGHRGSRSSARRPRVMPRDRSRTAGAAGRPARASRCAPDALRRRRKRAALPVHAWPPPRPPRCRPPGRGQPSGAALGRGEQNRGNCPARHQNVSRRRDSG